MASAAGSGDRFAAGKWEIEAWLESGGRSARGAPGATMRETVYVSPEQASAPPAQVFFTHFYHGAHNPSVTFRGGRVEGGFHQPRVDPIAEHDVRISGSYARDRFRVIFAYRAFGTTINQVAEGRLIDPAAR